MFIKLAPLGLSSKNGKERVFLQKEFMTILSANPAEVERYLKGMNDPAKKHDLIKKHSKIRIWY